MNKPEIIREIAKLTSLSGWQIDMVYEGMVQVIRENLAKGNNIWILGLGEFYLRYQAAKPDWKWGPVEAPQKEKVYPGFRFHQSFKEAVDQGKCQKDPKQFMSKRKREGGRTWELRRKQSSK